MQGELNKIVYVPPLSSAERQRRFRERHPGYYARLQAKLRATAKRDAKRQWESLQHLLQAQHTVSAKTVETPNVPMGC